MNSNMLCFLYFKNSIILYFSIYYRAFVFCNKFLLLPHIIIEVMFMNIESNKVEKCLKQNDFNNSDGDNRTHIKKSLNRGRVFFLQIFVCFIVFAVIFIMKTLNMNLFYDFKIWYQETTSNNMINEKINYKSFFSDLFSGSINKNSFKNQTAGVTAYPVYFSETLASPVRDGVVTSDFGAREDPFSGEKKNHLGLDIGAKENAEILAVLPGKVAAVGESSSYGKYLILDHGNEIKTLYAHSNNVIVKEGDSIKRGQAIALVGSTGESTGNHLHLELSINNIKYDPKPLLASNLDKKSNNNVMAIINLMPTE